MTQETREKLLKDCFESFMISYAPEREGEYNVEDFISTNYIVELLDNVFHFDEDEIVEQMVIYGFITTLTNDGVYWRIYTKKEEEY